jgi:hypothetical protein
MVRPRRRVSGRHGEGRATVAARRPDGHLIGLIPSARPPVKSRRYVGFRFEGVPADRRCYWLVFEKGQADVCFKGSAAVRHGVPECGRAS